MRFQCGRADGQVDCLISYLPPAIALKRITPPDWYLFEPHQPELSEFKPNTFVDITPVMDKKIKAMNVMSAQGYLIDYYTELAARRGNHARRISGKGLIDLPLIQVVPKSRVAGKARTVQCGQGDNVMVHACIEHIQPGEIVVLAQPESQASAQVSRSRQIGVPREPGN